MTGAGSAVSEETEAWKAEATQSRVASALGKGTGLTRHEGVSIRFLLDMFHSIKNALGNKLVAADAGGCGLALNLQEQFG